MWFKSCCSERTKLAEIYNHLRQGYDGQVGTRGRSDQSVAEYELVAPIVLAGEESPDEAAVRERSIELLYSKKDLEPVFIA